MGTTLDFQFRIYAVLLTIGLYLFCLIRYPAANCWLGFTTIGLGGQYVVLDSYFAKLATAMQCLAFLHLLLLVLLRGKDRRLFRLVFSTKSLFLIVLAVVWGKIAVEVMLYGLNEFRIFFIKTAIYSVFLPTGLFAVSLALDGLGRTLIGLVIGLCCYPLAYLAPLILPIILEGRIQDAILGETRLTTYLQDTINGGRMFFLGLLGFVAASQVYRKRESLRIPILCAAVLFFILMWLNGTRQYLFSILLAYGAILYLQGKTRNLIGFATLLALAVGIVFIKNRLSSAEMEQRIQLESLQSELASSRGEIWTRALEVGLSNPFTGVGFCNFGEVIYAQVAETGETAAHLSEAHGFFQGILAEHGILLMALSFAAFVHSIYVVLRCRKREDSQLIHIMLIVLVALLLPHFFSGDLSNSLPFYMLSIFASLIPALETNQEAQRPMLVGPQRSLNAA